MSKTEDLLEKSFNCPVCGYKFKALKVRSRKIRVTHRDPDGCAHFIGENPYFYNISICPECGYAATEDRFESIGFERKEIITERITPNWQKRDINRERDIEDAINTHKIALHQALITDDTRQYIGLLAMFLAWLYRYIEDTKNERKFLEYALDNFQKSYESEAFTKSFPIERCAFLIGEIFNTFKKYDDAVKWYNIALEHSSLNPGMEKQIRERWQIVSQARRRE